MVCQMHSKLKTVLIILSIIIKNSLCLPSKSSNEHEGSLSSNVNVANFNENDIFNANLIPVQIMTDELFHVLNANSSNMDNLFIEISEFAFCNSSDLSSAVKTMSYHRNMMNEFLVSDYLSKGIIESASNATISRRFGRAKNYTNTDVDAKNLSSVPRNHKLLDDEGSSQYSTWLKRMATLEDVQQHLQKKNKQDNNLKSTFPANRRQSMNINFMYDDGLETLEDGDITGYAYANNPNDFSHVNSLYKNHQKSLSGENFFNSFKPGISKTGYDGAYDDYTPPLIQPNLSPSVPSKQMKEVGLKDITDIGLTTLAFLSFGMFILQVLMCITMNKDDTSSMVMLPMEGADNGDLPVDENTDEIRRKRRSIYSLQSRNTEEIDQLAKRALFSLKAVDYLSKDNGACYYYSLCDNNKYSRGLRDAKKLWIPIWSLGISWLTIKFTTYIQPPSTSKVNPVVESLKATMIGLNNGECSLYYKNKC